MVDAAESFAPTPQPHQIGRYAVVREIASGGMASVWLARQQGDGGFSRVVAVKRLFPQFAKDPEFVTMFRDEARLATRIRHPNVVPTLDVAALDGELMLVMEYVAGESLSRLLTAARARNEPVDPAIAVAVITDVLEGLHAAHQATNEGGLPLLLVHRDVSPQNVIVGADGVARVFDFGVAKAVGRFQRTTESGQVKGKVVYMPPEQVFGEGVDRRSDIWSASVVLWEMLSGRRLFADLADAIRFHGATAEVEAPGDSAEIAALGPVLQRGLARKPDDRFATAREMIVALERAVPRAPPRRLAQWVQKLARDTLRERAAYVMELEADAPNASAPISASPTATATPDEATTKGPASMVTPKRSGTSRRVLAIGVAVVALAAVLMMMMRARVDDAARRRAETDASPSGADTSVTGALAPSSAAAPSAPVVPQAIASAPPAPSPRVNAKRPVTQRPSAASAPPPPSSDPLDPESRK